MDVVADGDGNHGAATTAGAAVPAAAAAASPSSLHFSVPLMMNPYSSFTSGMCCGGGGGGGGGSGSGSGSGFASASAHSDEDGGHSMDFMDFFGDDSGGGGGGSGTGTGSGSGFASASAHSDEDGGHPMDMGDGGIVDTDDFIDALATCAQALRFTHFRPEQILVLREVLVHNKDALISVPTAWGKTILATVPALCSCLNLLGRGSQSILIIAPNNTVLHTITKSLSSTEAISFVAPGKGTDKNVTFEQALRGDKNTVVTIPHKITAFLGKPKKVGAPNTLTQKEMENRIRLLQTRFRNGYLVYDEAHTATSMVFPDYAQSPVSLGVVLPPGTLQRVAMSATISGDEEAVRHLKELLGFRTGRDEVFTHITSCAREDVQLLVINVNNVKSPSKVATKEQIHVAITISYLRKLHLYAVSQNAGTLALLPTVNECHDLMRKYVQASGMDSTRAAVLTGSKSMSESTQRGIVDRFNRGEVSIIFATEILTMGANFKRASTAVIAEGAYGGQSVIQFAGRLMRDAEVGAGMGCAVMIASSSGVSSDYKNVRDADKSSVPLHQADITSAQLLKNFVFSSVCNSCLQNESQAITVNGHELVNCGTCAACIQGIEEIDITDVGVAILLAAYETNGLVNTMALMKILTGVAEGSAETSQYSNAFGGKTFRYEILKSLNNNSHTLLTFAPFPFPSFK